MMAWPALRHLPLSIAILTIYKLLTQFRYDPATQKWDYLSPMTNARFDFNLAVLNGRLYAAGGTTTDTNQPNESFDSVECYNPTIDQWTHVSSMTRRRCQASFAVSDDRLYIFGGYDNDLTVNSAIDTVECYNPIDNTWTAVRFIILIFVYLIVYYFL